MKLHLSVDPWAVVCDIGVDPWVLRFGTSVSPWSGSDDFAVVSGWTARVSLACVFTASSDTSAEHTVKDGAVVVGTSVAGGLWDNVDVDTVKLIGVAEQETVNS